MAKRRAAVPKKKEIEEEETEIMMEEEEEEEDEAMTLVPEPAPTKKTIQKKRSREAETQKPAAPAVAQPKAKKTKTSEEEGEVQQVEEEEEEEEEDPEKEKERIEKLKAEAQDKWIIFLKGQKDVQGKDMATSLISAVDPDTVTVQIEDKNGRKFVNGKYAYDLERKKLASLTKWLPPCFVKYQWSGLHGNYDPENQYNDTYDKSRYTFTFSEKLPPDFVEYLDGEWLQEHPEFKGPGLPHEVWQEAITGTFERIMNQQEALLKSYYKVINQVFPEEKLAAMRKSAETSAAAMITSGMMPGAKVGGEAYKRLVEHNMEQFFMNVAKRTIHKIEDKGQGQYELRVKRRIFRPATDEEKKKQVDDIAMMRSQGEEPENLPAAGPYLQGLRPQPLKVIDCNRKWILPPIDFKMPIINNGAMASAKLYLMPFLHGDTFGISGQLRSFGKEEEIRVLRPGKPGDNFHEPPPEFPGGVAPAITHETEPKDINPFTQWANKMLGANPESNYRALPAPQPIVDSP